MFNAAVWLAFPDVLPEDGDVVVPVGSRVLVVEAEGVPVATAISQSTLSSKYSISAKLRVKFGQYDVMIDNDRNINTKTKKIHSNNV